MKLSYLRPFIAYLFKKSYWPGNVTVLTTKIFIPMVGLLSLIHLTIFSMAVRGELWGVWHYGSRGEEWWQFLVLKWDLWTCGPSVPAPARSVVQVLVGRWAGRMSGKYPTLQTGGRWTGELVLGISLSLTSHNTQLLLLISYLSYISYLHKRTCYIKQEKQKLPSFCLILGSCIIVSKKLCRSHA